MVRIGKPMASASSIYSLISYTNPTIIPVMVFQLYLKLLKTNFG